MSSKDSSIGQRAKALAKRMVGRVEPPPEPKEPPAEPDFPDPMHRRFEGGLLKGIDPEYIERRKPILERLVKAAWDNRGFNDSFVLDPDLAQYDERVVEYPYAMGAAAEASKDGKIQLLDVGCVLNNPCIAPMIRYNVAEMLWLMNPSIEPLAYKERVTYVLADMREQTLPDSLQFPLVTCLSTLEHTGMDNTRYGGKPQEFEGELLRPDKFAIDGLRGFTKHVAPGGKLVVSVPFGPFEYVYKYENPDKPIYYTFNKEMVLAMKDSLTEFDTEITIFKIEHGTGWVRTTLDDDDILRHAENCVAAGGVAFLDCVRRG